jgi:hypothetical protein
VTSLWSIDADGSLRRFVTKDRLEHGRLAIARSEALRRSDDGSRVT